MEPDEEEGQIPVSQPMIMGHTSEGALQYQLETTDIVDQVVQILKGYAQVKDNKTGFQVWKQLSKPMINDKGLDRVRSYLTLILGGQKIFALTDLEESQIGDEVVSIGMDFVRDFEDNYIPCGIPDATTASYIVRWINLITNAVLKKGEDATYLKFLRTTQQIQEVQHHQSMQQKMSMPQERKGLKEMLLGNKRR